jgi:hypothetical protein
MSRPQSDNGDVTLSEAVFGVRVPGFVAIRTVEPMGDFALKAIRRSVATYDVVEITTEN